MAGQTPEGAALGGRTRAWQPGVGAAATSLSWRAFGSHPHGCWVTLLGGGGLRISSGWDTGYLGVVLTSPSLRPPAWRLPLQPSILQPLC